MALSHVNTWADMPGYFYDGEWTRLTLDLARGVGSGFEVRAQLAIAGRSGGFLDGLIMGFHSFAHVTQARRDRFRRNMLRVTRRTLEGENLLLTDRDGGIGLQNSRVGLRYRATPENLPVGLILNSVLEIPLGNHRQAYASSSFSLLVDATTLVSLGPYVQFDLAYGLIIAPRIAEFMGFHLNETRKFLFSALEFRLAARVHLVLQYLNQDGLVETLATAPLNQTTHEFALGVLIDLGSRSHSQKDTEQASVWLLELGIIENGIHDANTPDFGFLLGLTWRPANKLAQAVQPL